MFKTLKNILLNSYIVSKTTEIIPSAKCLPPQLASGFPDPDHGLQYQTTNSQNFPSKMKDNNKEKLPSHRTDFGRVKQHSSPSRNIATKKMDLERKLQKQFILPVCFPTSVNEKEKDYNQKHISPNDLLSYCIETSITSPKGDQYPSICSPYSPPSLASYPEPSPRKTLADFPKDYPSREKFVESVLPPCPPWRTPVFPCLAKCTQPYDLQGNPRLLKLPLCPLCPSDCTEPHPPPPIRLKCYTQPRENPLPPKQSPNPAKFASSSSKRQSVYTYVCPCCGGFRSIHFHPEQNPQDHNPPVAKASNTYWQQYISRQETHRVSV